MLVKDIDKRLDMRLVIKLRQDTELFAYTKGIPQKFPVYIYGKDGKAWMATYFPKTGLNKNMEIFIKKFNATELDNAYVIDSRINNVKDLIIINKLLEVPSFSVGITDMSEGFLNIYARFHSSRLVEISNLLAEYMDDIENSRISWLGPSDGIIAILESVNSDYPISIVSYKVSIGNEDVTLKDIISSEPNILAEGRNYLPSDNKMSHLIYSDQDISGKYNGVKAISSKNGIYQMELYNEIINIIIEEANKRHIWRLRYFIKPCENGVEVSVFLPESSVYEYYSMLFSKVKDNGNKIVVSRIMPFTNKIWDYL